MSGRVLGSKKDYISGREKDGVHYFIVVKPNGQFELYSKNIIFPRLVMLYWILVQTILLITKEKKKRSCK